MTTRPQPAEVKRKPGRPRNPDGAPTSAERHAFVTNRENQLVRMRCQDPEVRAAMEADPPAWLRRYLPQAYGRPWDRPHLEIISGAIRADETGGRFAVAAERGIGKSAVLYGLVLYLALSGRRRFPTYLPWSASVMKRGLQFWRAALSFNEHILRSYPEYAQPFAHARGYSNRMRSLCWADTGKPTGAGLQVSDGMIVFPDNLGVIGGSTVNGNPRGLNLPQPDGSVLRPDLALIDDPQDRKVARSVVLSSETVAKIDGDIAGLGTAGAAFPLLMSGNCVLAGDVMERYLADPNWRSLRVSCVEAWPDGWEDRGPAHRLWAEWWQQYHNDAGDGLAFYQTHRTEMTAGMRLSAPMAYDAQRTDELPDALCVAMRQYWQMGHEAFSAERQQLPVTIESRAELVVQPEQILARAIGPARGVAPDGAIKIVAGADINPGTTSRLGARVTWACLAFQREQIACVVAYGIERIPIPHNPTDAQRAAVCFASLAAVRAKVGEYGCELMLYDARGNWAPRGVALQYAMMPDATNKTQIIPAEGWSNEYYRPTHKTAVRAFEGGHESRDSVDGVRRTWIAWNADHFGETVLRAWMSEPGAPGSCILYAGTHAREFAEQASMKRLVGKLSTSKGVRYDWADRVGDQDYGDAVSMAFAAAAYGGIGTGGYAPPGRQRKQYSQADLTRR